jgi:hypothetical protein
MDRGRQAPRLHELARLGQSLLNDSMNAPIAAKSAADQAGSPGPAVPAIAS